MTNASSFSPLIIGIGGTARPRSTTERAVELSLQIAQSLGARTMLFDGEFVSQLPLYVPGRPSSGERERMFIDAIRRCHGVIVGTPAYHGCLSGPIKNVLDLIEDTAGDECPYLDGRSFGCIVMASGSQACGTALISLRTVAHALRAWPTPFGATVNASTPIFDADGGCLDARVSHQLSVVASQVVEFARCRYAHVREFNPVQFVSGETV
jgi:FMN reductase